MVMRLPPHPPPTPCKCVCTRVCDVYVYGITLTIDWTICRVSGFEETLIYRHYTITSVFSISLSMEYDQNYCYNVIFFFLEILNFYFFVFLYFRISIFSYFQIFAFLYFRISLYFLFLDFRISIFSYTLAGNA